MSDGEDDRKNRSTRPVEVLRRPREERKGLPAELEAFARGDDDALWRRPRNDRRLNDPRPVAAALVTGVANRDARMVYEGRVRRLRSAIDSGDEYLLAEELAEAVRLAIWRGNSVVGFDVFAEAVLGLVPERARELVAQGAASIEVPAQIADEAEIALWMRAEAGLLEISPDAKASIRGGRLVLDLPVARAAEALAGVGRRAAPMARPPTGPSTMVDRPKGVPRLSTLERTRDDDD